MGRVKVGRAKVGRAKVGRAKVGRAKVGRAKIGLSFKDALSKAMKLRKLAPETCAVTLVNDPDKVSC